MLQPENTNDQARWQHTRLRRNMLQGTWEQEIQERMREQMGLTNVGNLGRPSTSVNLLENTTDQTAIIYDAAPTVTNPAFDEQQAKAWSDTVNGAHLWGIMQDVCAKTVGLRECFLWVVPTSSGVQLEIVTPDEIVVTATTGDASSPTALKRAVTFAVTSTLTGKTEHIDCWECWDVSDPANPTHTVMDGEGHDVTADVYPDDNGVYIYTDEQGPYLPCVLYRARYTGDTFDPYWGSGLVHGTLDIGIAWTVWSVCLRNNSWPQWYLVDGVVPGQSIGDTAGMLDGISPPPGTIELAPNSIIRFKSEGGPGSAKVGQLTPCDAKLMAEAIMIKQNTILNNVGIHPDDLSNAGQPMSGVAIQLKKSSSRKIATAMVPMFRDADSKLYNVMARVHNVFYADSEAGIPALPTEGWQIQYNLPEMSTDEFLADLAKDETLIELGLLSKVDVAMKFYSLTDPAAAVRKLQEVAQYNLMFPFTPPVTKPKF